MASAMAPPKDRLAAMQANTYFEDDDSFNIPVDEEHSGAQAEFFKEVEEVRGLCEKINEKINEVKKTQTDILSAPALDKVKQAGLDDCMAEIKKHANATRSRLKKMEQETETEEKSRGATAEIRMRKTQHMATSRRFVEVMTEYNRIQVDFRERSKEKIKRQMEISGSTATDEELEQMLEGGGGARLTGHIHIEGNEDQLRQTINDIEARHEMFMKLEASIKELHEMFIDIAMLIENQGEMVNRIDAHVESAVEYTTRATNDTKKALEYQSKARRKKIMMLICMIVCGSLGTYIAGSYLGIF